MPYPTSFPGRAFQQIDVRSRLAFHWRASDLSLKAVTGQQGVFSRASPGGLVLGRGTRTWRDAEARMLVGPIGDDAPRFGLEDAAAGDLVAALTVEGASTNQVADHDIAPTGDGATVTAGEIYDPTGARKGHRITANGGVGDRAYGWSGASVSAGSGYVISGQARHGTAPYVAVGDVGDSAWHRIWVNQNLAVTAVESATSYGVRNLGGGWFRWWIYVAAAGATHTPAIFTCPSNASGSLNTTAGQYCWSANTADERGIAFASSHIPTAGSAVTRAAESLHWPFLLPPTAMTVYARFVERGTLTKANAGILSIGSSGGAHIRIGDGGGSAYFARYNDGATSRDMYLGAPTAPAIGQRVELVLTLTAAGVAQLSQSLAGGPAVATAAAAATPIPSAWGAQELWLGSLWGTTQGFAGFIEAKVARGVWSLQHMREVV